MAQLTVTVPDALVPRVVAALAARYPELAGGTNTAIGRGGVRLLLKEVLAQTEARAAELNGYDAMVAAADAARIQANADADTIT